MKKQPLFTQPESDQMMKFEEEIAYFFGAKDIQRIAENYLKALLELEKIGIQSDEGVLAEAMVPHLIAAYAEVENQTPLRFDTHKAAFHEFRLIIAQASEASFEQIYGIMLDLYREVFSSNHNGIHKAAMLRTFLYKYKISLLRTNGELSEDDQELMLSIATASEKELSKNLKW